MRKIYLTIILNGFVLTLFGQAPTDSISMIKVFGGYQFYQHQKVLKVSVLDDAMSSNEQAYKEIKAAQSTYTLATIVSGIGGFMVGWPLGTAVGGGDPNWTLAGIGVGLIVISIPINQKFNRQAKEAIKTFNKGYRETSFLERLEINLAFTGNTVGLKMRF